MTKSKRIFTQLLLVISVLLLSACSAGSGNEQTTIKLALLPILDTLPIYVAQEAGLFEENGVSVEVVPVSSAPERDQLINAKQVDGMVNELVSTLFYNQENIEIQVVRYARVATSNSPMFRILASPDSGINSLDDLKGVEIGISNGTIIEYLTYRLLENESFSSEDIATISIPAIPDRFALIGSGELKAGMLPDPLASLAIQNGAVTLIDDSIHPQYAFSVLTFRKEFIDLNPNTVKNFLKSIEEATELINQDPSEWNTLLVDNNLVPPPLLGSYQIPEFPVAGVPTIDQWDDVVNWATAAGLYSGGVDYEDSVTMEYLP